RNMATKSKKKLKTNFKEISNTINQSDSDTSCSDSEWQEVSKVDFKDDASEENFQIKNIDNTSKKDPNLIIQLQETSKQQDLEQKIAKFQRSIQIRYLKKIFLLKHFITLQLKLRYFVLFARNIFDIAFENHKLVSLLKNSSEDNIETIKCYLESLGSHFGPNTWSYIDYVVYFAS
ncbi:MAG: hypothetical protein MHPSP_003260, partial [Paramarteilia canceri]